MKKYILKRLLQLIPVVILVSIFSFLIIQAAPGDPINNYVKSGMSGRTGRTGETRVWIRWKYCSTVLAVGFCMFYEVILERR